MRSYCFAFPRTDLVELVQKTVDKPGGGILGLIAEQVLFGRFASVGKFKWRPVVIVAVAAAADRDEMNVHDRQPRHHKRT